MQRPPNGVDGAESEGKCRAVRGVYETEGKGEIKGNALPRGRPRWHKKPPVSARSVS